MLAPGHIDGTALALGPSKDQHGGDNHQGAGENGRYHEGREPLPPSAGHCRCWRVVDHCEPRYLAVVPVTQARMRSRERGEPHVMGSTNFGALMVPHHGHKKSKDMTILLGHGGREGDTEGVTQRRSRDHMV